MMITVFGIVALATMMMFYAFEKRNRHFTLAFSLSCVLTALYGYLSGAWPFAVVELIWAGIAFKRWKAEAD